MAAPQLAIAYDGSPSAVTAVRAAAALFPGARAVVVTVPDPPPPAVYNASRFLMNAPSGTFERALEEITEQTLEEARGVAAAGVEHAAGLDAEAHVTKPHQPAWEALMQAARGADVLVCGSRERNELARTVLGSTSTSVLHHAELPVLVVPDETEATGEGPVLIAYDGSEAADRAIETAGRLLPGREARVVHVYESQYRDSRAVQALAHGQIGELVTALDQALTEEAEACARTGAERASAAGLHAQAETVQASAGVWRTMVRLVGEHGASLVVTGSRGQGGARSVLLGSVSSALVHHADAPVLVAR